LNVLITGGTGFIGSNLALECAKRGHSVRVLGQENTEAETGNANLIKSKGIEVLLTNVLNFGEVRDSVKDVDVVFHLAAAQHESNVPDQYFWDVNVNGTKNLLDACVAAQVKRFVYGSTVGVYGSGAAGVLDEETPACPDNIYGVTKLAAERLVQSYMDQLSLVIIRISETYGPGDRRLLKLFRAVGDRTFFMIGDGNNLHHPIYIDDLTEGLLVSASSDAANGKVIILAGREPLTTKEMVSVIADQLGVSVREFHVPLVPLLMVATVIGRVFPAMGVHPPIYRRRMDFFTKNLIFSQEKASRVLEFTPEYSFEHGVYLTARWYQENGFLQPASLSTKEI
jgi:nucleoside-diphosphate-sugar epimerase